MSANWLLLVHQVPPKPDYLRVKVRRRLDRIGAQPLRSTVYCLPERPATLEDFQWLRREIIGDGGEATLLSTTLLEGLTDEEMVARFTEASNSGYRAIVEQAAALRASAPADRDVAGGTAITRLSQRLQEVIAVDFFSANGRAEADAAIASLRVPRAQEAGDGAPRPRGATWITRPDVHVDRLASAWLIRRFIDPAATFRFDGGAGQPGTLRFDMFGGEYTHEGADCTFETLVRRFAITDPAVSAIAEVVHDLDCKDDAFGRAETPGIGLVIDAICSTHADDEARVARATTLFDDLAVHYRQKAAPVAPRRVAFVCLHGSAKSQVACAHFLARAAGRLPGVTATSLGTEPDDAIPTRVVEGLQGDGLVIDDATTRLADRRSLGQCSLVVSFIGDLGPAVPPGIPVLQWTDVPAVSDGYPAARDAIVAHVEQLVETMSSLLQQEPAP